MKYTQYFLSPFRQRPFLHFFSDMPHKFFRKVSENFLIVSPGFVFGIGLYEWSNHKFHHDVKHEWP